MLFKSHTANFCCDGVSTKLRDARMKIRRGGRPRPCSLARAEEDNRQRPGKEKEDSHSSLQSQALNLVADDPDTQDRLERVRQAAAIVASLQAQREELDKEITSANYASAWERQDQERRQAQQAAERGADADILRAADSLEQAQAELTAALSEQNKWSSAVDEAAEKVESAKAGAVAAAAATASALPFVLSSGASGLVAAGSLGSVLVTGLLFGVTYRYAVRQDVGNTQLKSGVVAAFGLVRGLALAEEVLRGGNGDVLATAGSAAISAGESMLVVGFGAAALELAMQKGFVRTFGDSRKR